MNKNQIAINISQAIDKDLQLNGVWGEFNSLTSERKAFRRAWKRMILKELGEEEVPEIPANVPRGKVVKRYQPKCYAGSNKYIELLDTGKLRWNLGDGTYSHTTFAKFQLENDYSDMGWKII